MTPLAGTVSVITGSSGAIGAAIALALARAGSSLCLLGRSQEGLERIRIRVAEAAGARAAVYRADLASLPEIEAAVGQIRADAGRVDILVHAAGLLSFESIEKTSVEVLDRQYAVNLRAPYVLTRLLLPELKRQRGQVVFVNSSLTTQPGKAKLAAYAATKAALKAFADSLRAEVNPLGVRVLSIYPGRTASAMQEMVHRLEDKEYRPQRLLQPEDLASAVVHALGLPRTAEVTDIHIQPSTKP